MDKFENYILLFFIFSAEAIERNQQLEFERNIEKLQIMKVKLLIISDFVGDPKGTRCPDMLFSMTICPSLILC